MEQGMSESELKEQLKEQYKMHLSDVDAEDEIAANFAGKILGDSSAMERMIRIAGIDEGEGGMSVSDKQDGIDKLVSSAKRLILGLKKEQFDFDTTVGIDKMKKAVRLYDKTFAEAVKSKKKMN